jgi:hypothetical protein
MGSGYRGCAMHARRACAGLCHVLGKADAVTLCASYNIGIHSCKPLAHRHEGLPIVTFFSALTDAPIPLRHREHNEAAAAPSSLPRLQNRLPK